MSLLVSGEQASKQMDFSGLSLLDNIVLFNLLGCYFSGMFCTFHLGQMFIRILMSAFDFY